MPGDLTAAGGFTEFADSRQFPMFHVKRAALYYLLFYQFQEMLNPGYLA